MSLPNTISLARLLSVPITVWLLLVDELMAAFILFVLAGVSDAVDGFIAKRYDNVTELGSYLDPIADKTLLVAVYITLGLQDHLPLWLVILVVSRDLLIIGGAVLLTLLGFSIQTAPLKISKVNTAAQITLAAAVMGQIALELSLAIVVELLILVVAATTVLSGGRYLVEWARRVSNSENHK
ncbi:MAG: CDP-alcohol phosphatidyltransferase family protein [Alphaproteobacteria bacterium]